MKQATTQTKQATTETIGVDVSDRKSRICVLSVEGEVIEERWITTTKHGMKQYFGKASRSRVVFEAGTHALWMKWVIEELDHEVIVANPRNLGLIYKSRKKSDPHDARRLAQLGRVDPDLLSPVQLRDRDAQVHLAQIRSRAMLIATRTKLVNHVRGQVKALGHRVKSCDPDQFPAAVTSSLPPEVEMIVEPALKVILGLTEQLQELDRAIEATAATEYAEAVKQLTQVYGIGTLTALSYILVLSDPTRFRQSRRVGAYLGLVPQLDQSGDGDPQLGITHAGETYLRTLLVGCAQTILKASSPDTDLKRAGLRIMERGGKNAKKRAAVAVARRLAVLLHRLWISGETYVPLGYGTSYAKAA